QFNPAVDLGPNKVFYDSIEGYFTYPEYLMNVSDFIMHFKSTWARSLVIYHPEYCYYEVCSQLGKKHGNDTMTSDQFDDLLLNVETYQEAVNKNFINTSASNPSQIIYNLASNNSPIYDPFLTNPSVYNQFSLYYDYLAEFTYSYNSYKVLDNAWR